MWNLLFLISVLVASPQSRVSDCVAVLCKKSDSPRLGLVMISIFLVQLKLESRMNIRGLHSSPLALQKVINPNLSPRCLKQLISIT